MRIRLLLAFVLCLIWGSAAHADIRWETSYPTAVARAKATGKPLFIDIYTDWCGWCKKLDTEVYTDPRIQQMARNYVMLKVNAETGTEGPKTAKAFKVTGFPTVIMASSTGQILYRTAYLKPDDMLMKMSESYQSNSALRAQALRNPQAAVVPRRTTVESGKFALKNQSELRQVATSSNYGGAFLLDDGGVVALDKPAKKNARAKQRKRQVTTLRRR